jgi:hypothetical protein
VSFRRRLRVGMIAKGALPGLLVWLHLQSRSIPYIRGVTSPGAIAFLRQRPADVPLRRASGHFLPGAGHIFIDVLSVAACLLCPAATCHSPITGSRRSPQAARGVVP